MNKDEKKEGKYRGVYMKFILEKKVSVPITQVGRNIKSGKCEFCNADFFSRTTLWRHKKKCTYQQENTEVLASNNKRELQQHTYLGHQCNNNQ